MSVKLLISVLYIAAFYLRTCERQVINVAAALRQVINVSAALHQVINVSAALHQVINVAAALHQVINVAAGRPHLVFLPVLFLLLHRCLGVEL